MTDQTSNAPALVSEQRTKDPRFVEAVEILTDALDALENHIVGGGELIDLVRELAYLRGYSSAAIRGALQLLKERS